MKPRDGVCFRRNRAKSEGGREKATPFHLAYLIGSAIWIALLTILIPVSTEAYLLRAAHSVIRDRERAC